MRAYGLARLTKDIEKVSDNLYRVSLAENIYNSQTKEQDGHFWNAIAFGKKGEALFNSVHKGDRINITNSIMKNNNYEKDGVMKYGTQIVIFDFDFIEKKGTNNGGDFAREEGKHRQDDFTPKRSTPTIDVSEDDLPF